MDDAQSALRYRRRSKEGRHHLWLVDPKARTLEAFGLQGGAWVLIAALKEGEEVRAPPFDAIACPLLTLWPD